MGRVKKTAVDVAIGVLVRDGRILIARRPDEVVLGGCWELPGGKVEPGETPADCVVREFAEEVGLTVAVGEALEVIEHAYDHATVRLRPYWCTLVAGEVRHLAVAEHRWVRPGELAAFRFPAANDRLMRRIAAALECDHE